MLLLISLGWFLAVGVRMMYPVLLPHLRVAYDLDLALAGFLLTVLWLAFAFGQFPAGVLADRLGEGVIMALSLAVTALILTLVVTAVTTVVLFAATALFGFGMALYSVARLSALPDLFPDQLGATVGIVAASSDAGRAVLPPIAGLLALVGSWQMGFGFTIPLFVLVAVGVWIVVPAETSAQSTAVDEVSVANLRYIAAALLTRPIVTGSALMVLGFAIWTAFTGFYPTYLLEEKGLSATVTSGLFGLFFVMGIGVKPLSGAAYDEFGIRRTLVAVLVVSGLALAAVPMTEGIWPLVAITVLASPLASFGIIIQSYLLEALPDDMQGTGLGLLRFGFITLGALSPVVFGTIADRGFFDEGFFLLAGTSLVMLLGALVIPRTPTGASATG
jgi:MFS family permease